MGDDENIILDLDGNVWEDGTRMHRQKVAGELERVDQFIALCEARNWKFDSPADVMALDIVSFGVRQPREAVAPMTAYTPEGTPEFEASGIPEARAAALDGDFIPPEWALLEAVYEVCNNEVEAAIINRAADLADEAV